MSFTSAGNSSQQNDITGYKAITVSALKEDGNGFAFDDAYSNYGKLVDISAPGSRILSAGISDTELSRIISVITLLFLSTIQAPTPVLGSLLR